MEDKSNKPDINVPYKDSIYSYELDYEKYHNNLNSESNKNSFKFKYAKSSKWKLGDWCICDMQIKQIVAIDKEKLEPYTVSNGYINSGICFWKERLFPLTLRNKNIAEYFNKLYEELRKYKNLNLSILRQYFECKSIECMKGTQKDDQKRFSEIEVFQKEVIEAAKEQSQKRIDGLLIFNS